MNENSKNGETNKSLEESEQLLNSGGNILQKTYSQKPHDHPKQHLHRLEQHFLLPKA